MRIMISALLLASAAAMPAFAQDAPQRHHGDGGQRQHDGNGQGGDRGDRGDRGDHGRPNGGGQPGGGRPDFQGQAPGGQGRFDGGRPQPDGRPGGGGDGQHFDGGRPNGQGQSGGSFGGPGGDGGRHITGRPDNGVTVWHGDGQPGGPGRGDHHSGDWRPGGGYSGGGDHGGWDRGRQPSQWAGNPHGGGGWNNGWRQDRRYDWQGYRDSHRDIFRGGGGYRAPYGYGGYRRWGIGVRIAPAFFAQDYWIGDPGYYRLPPAYGPYRWVRYYNDALLVNIYNGQVVDEIPDFFW